MPTATYIALANLTLTGADGEITFSSIPATYRDLVLVIDVPGLSGTPTTAGAKLRFNADTGNNYNSVYMRGTGSTTTSPSEANVNAFTDFLFSTDNAHNAIVQIMDYSATDKHKTILSRTNEPAGLGVAAYAGRWASTDAITSLTIISPDTGGKTFDSGSTFALYGIVS